MPTVIELRAEAKALKIKGYSKMNKEELCKALKKADSCYGNKKTSSPKPSASGRKVNVRKSPCQQNTDKYVWIVGKGCFEKDVSRISQSDIALLKRKYIKELKGYIKDNDKLITKKAFDDLISQAVNETLNNKEFYEILQERPLHSWNEEEFRAFLFSMLVSKL